MIAGDTGRASQGGTGSVAIAACNAPVRPQHCEVSQACAYEQRRSVKNVMIGLRMLEPARRHKPPPSERLVAAAARRKRRAENPGRGDAACLVSAYFGVTFGGMVSRRKPGFWMNGCTSTNRCLRHARARRTREQADSSGRSAPCAESPEDPHEHEGPHRRPPRTLRVCRGSG